MEHEAIATPVHCCQSQDRSQGQIPAIAKASDIELCRPSPIQPPNHCCSWRDRYLALAGETRSLKAEISARAALMGEEVPQFARREATDASAAGVENQGQTDDGDDLGLEGITIVLHMRDRDDLVIETDLTQSYPEEEDSAD